MGGNEIYNKCFIIINNIYIEIKDTSKYSTYIINGKYKLKQSSGAIINMRNTLD